MRFHPFGSLSCGLFLFLLLPIACIRAHLRWIEAKVPLQGTPAPPGTPWPLPRQILQIEQQFQLISSEFNFTVNDLGDCSIVKDATNRYNRILFPCERFSSKAKPSPAFRLNGQKQLQSLEIQVKNGQDCGYPHSKMDESYELRISDQSPDPKAVLLANSVWGALRGLETFSQLVYTQEFIKGQTNCVYRVNASTILDQPAYSHRGLMLDTSRHFLPLSTILAHLDAMAYNKLNVFHWHIVDDQSWPFESRVHSELHTNGAYTPRHVYTQDDIRHIVEYARARGIRVLPELDTPGHTFSLPKRLLTACYAYRTNQIRLHNWTIEEILKRPVNLEDYGEPYTGVYGVHGNYEILNPSVEEIFTYVLDLFLEMKTLFPDEHIHAGMDEVYYQCWTSNPDIIQFMKDRGFTRVSQVEEYYVSRTLRNIRDKVKRKYQIWQDPFDNGVQIDSDAVIQIWKGKNDEDDPHDLQTPWQEYARQVAEKKFNMVLSSCWYLNYIVYPYPNKDWERFYKCQPRSFSKRIKDQNLVIGGEACVWGEFADATVSVSRTWPRASAVAERLWLDPDTFDLDSVRFRLDDMRCRMVQRGLPAAPILNGYCGDYDWDLN